MPIKPIAVFIAIAFASLALHADDAPTLPPDDVGYADIAAPFLKQHCLKCHGPETQEGEFRVDAHLPNAFMNPAAKEKWSEVVNVLNSHEMPPEDERQPSPADTAKVVDWITSQLTRAELARRDSAIILRRLNRAEYANTIRDLIGVEFEPEEFPEDSPAGGFDNNGNALTLSPLHVELYFKAARAILDEALVEGEQPPALKWRIQPESGHSDSNRVTYDGQRIIVNSGKNRAEDGFIVMHHESWDRNINFRDFVFPHEGEYNIRIRAGGKVPTRDEIVASGEPILKDRFDRQMKENPRGEKYHQEAYDRVMGQFRNSFIYDYGPPRLKVVRNLGGQPETVAEFDVAAPLDRPETYEIRTKFRPTKAGVTLHYAYDLPSDVDNFWFQTGDVFARPEAWVDWIEVEGPVFESWPPPSHVRLLPDLPIRRTDEREYARIVLQRFMNRAYRRPATDAEVAEKLELYDAARKHADSFVQAIKSPLSAVLVSPGFLYLAEAGKEADESEPSSRVFTDSKGRTVRAAVLAVSDANVQIRRDDGAEFNVPIASFSVDDQKYIRTWKPTASHRKRLTDYELASRLSYFLWSSQPDDELLKLAAADQLHDSAELSRQVNRMLADERSAALAENFAGQWLGLREVGANPPAEDLYPKYDRHLEISIVKESQEFFREILNHDLSAMNFVQSDFVVVNERLARFYEIPGVRGDDFRRVQSPADSHRGGVVTQASVLSITSNGTRTSPVKRGVWIMKNLLGTDPGLPVANAGEISPKVPGVDKATVRQRLEIHRELPQCARCHNKIDPLGFALENFNAMGDWRTQEGFGYKGRVGPNDPVIDASSQLPDGTEIEGAGGLQRALIERKELFLKCLAGKMLTYALGRELGVADNQHVSAAVEAMEQNDETLRSLIQFIAHSEPFQTK